jgi:hypothetical protein
MSNPCRICANPIWVEQAETWVREGVADREIAKRLLLTLGFGRYRHPLEIMV